MSSRHELSELSSGHASAPYAFRWRTALGNDPVCRVRLGRHDELDPEAAAPERAAGEVTRSGLKTVVSVRVLVVDDDAAIRDVCGDLIRDLGYEGHVVAAARETPCPPTQRTLRCGGHRHRAARHGCWQPNAAAIHEQPTLRLVVMRGGDEDGDRSRAHALGAPILQKPFTRVELRDALQETLTPFGPA